MSRLPRSFYCRNDVVGIARETLGKYLVSCFDGEITSGLITETEAYAGEDAGLPYRFLLKNR